MRQYLFGVLIVILGLLCSEALCDHNDQDDISNSAAYVLEVPDGLNGGPVSSDSVSSIEDEYQGLKSVEDEISDEDILGTQFPDVDESLAYWQSIYGTEDVPDFDVPPSIDGDSIFMDMSELTNDDSDEVEIVKRDVDEVQAPLVRQKRSGNFEVDVDTLSEIQHGENGKILKSQNCASKTVSTSKKEQRKSSRTTKTSRKSESRSSRRMTLHDVDSGIKCKCRSDSVLDSKRKLIQEKKDLIDAVVTGASQAKIDGAVQHTIEAKRDLIDSVISAKADLIHGKSDLIHSHASFDHDISLNTGVSGSIQSEGSLGPILNAAQEALQAKQDLLNVVVTGGSTAELADAVQHTIEAKQELIDSVISSKAELIQKGDIKSHGHHQRFIIDTGVSGSVESGSSLGHVLDSAQEALKAKQDLIDLAISGGNNAEVSGAIAETIKAKEALIDSVISDLMQKKRDLIRSHCCSGNSQGCSQCQESLNPIIDSAQELLQKKKDLIDVVAGRGTKVEFCDALHHTIGAKKDLIDSVISAKADLIQQKKDLINSHAGLEHGSSGSIISQGSLGQIIDLKKKVLKEKKNLIDVALSGCSESEVADAMVKILDAKGDQCQESLNPILDSAQELLQKKKDLIDVVAGRGTKAEFCDGLHDTIEAKKDLIDTVISAKADLIQQKKDLIDSHAGLEHGSSGSIISQGSMGQILDLKKKVLKEKKNLIDVALSGCSESEVADAMVKILDAKGDQCQESLNPIIDSAQELLQKKKDLIDVVAGRGTKAEFCDALHHTIGAKKDLIDSVISAKADLIQQKKDLINSHAGLEHGSSGSIVSQGSLEQIIDLKKKVLKEKKNLIDVALSGGSESEIADAMVKILDAKGDQCQESLHPILDSAQELLQKKKDLIDVVAGRGTKAEFCDGLHHTIGAKKDLIDTVISAKADLIQQKKDLINSHAGLEHGSSGSIVSQGSLEQIIDLKKKVLKEKKNLIDVALSGGSESEVADAMVQTLDAKGDLIDLVTSNRAERIHNRKEHHRHRAESSFCGRNRHRESSKTTNSQFSTNFQSGTSSSHKKIEGINLFPGGTAADIAIEGGIDVETSLNEDTSHHHGGSLVVNHGIRSGVQISGDLHSASSTKQIDVDVDVDVDSSSSSAEISSSNSGSIETKVSFGGSSSSESRSSESSEISRELGNISAEGEFKIVTNDAKDTLNVNIEAQGRGVSQITNIAVEGDAGVKISADDDICGDFSSSLSAEIESSIELSNSKGLFESEIAIDSGFDSTINSKFTINKGLAPDDSGIQIDGSIGLDVSTESQIELPDIEISGTIGQDDSLSIHKKCSSGECGITGKLHIGSDVTDENSHHEIIEEISEAENDYSITQLIEDIGQSETNVESGCSCEDLEGNSVTKINLNSGINIGVETSEQELESNFYIDINRDDYESSAAYEEEAIEQELGGATISVSTNVDVDVHSADDAATIDQLVDQEDGSSNIAVNLSGGSQTQITATKNLVVINGGFGDIENNQNQHHYSSSYDEYGGGYSIAPHHQDTSQTGGFSHFQHFDGTQSHSYFADNSDYFDADKIFSNAQYRLINSDDNCTGINSALNPECQRLNTVIWQSRDSGAPITLRTVKSYLSRGHEIASEMQNRAKWLCNKGLIPKRHTPAMLHLINNFASETTVEINLESEYSLFGTKLLQRRLSSEFHVTANTFVEFLRHHSFSIFDEGTHVIRPRRCPADDIYRTFDGSCNNQDYPTWGQSNTALTRLLPARYYDGVHEIPKSVNGKELPNARAVSVNCFSRKEVRDLKLTLAFVQWGQLLSHDLGMQTIDQTVEGGIQCCADGNRPLPKNLQHHSCLPIEISKNDKFYSRFGSSCMNFVRSMTIRREDGTLGPADQLNTVTSYLDASPVYGSNKETCDKLRAFKGGRMKVSIRRGRELLPPVANASRFCDVMSPNEVCYLAGDIRVNQGPQMAIIQTIFVREHNNVADRLAILNPHWDDERIFQETRKIVIAEYQCITYNEWLPLAIGEKYCRTHRLTPRFKNRMSRDYNPKVNAATINSFATGAFRLFHSMVDGHIDLCPASREISHTLRLSNHYFRPQIIEQWDNLDDLIRGFVTQSSNKADNNFHPEITEYLFRSKNEFGLDLAALDVQRARDHGICSYNKYREICGLRKAERFEDLIEEISYENIASLQRIYNDVNDVDLIVGASMERRSTGCAVGPTARCLIGEQFYRSRVGDRYFYNSAGHPHSFTKAQFEEISKVSFARLLCNNGDNIEEIQAKAFKTISPDNPLEYCCALGQIDLSPWKELRYD